MNQKQNRLSTKEIRIVVAILSFSVFICLLLCTIIGSNGVYRYLPIILFVLFTIISFFLYQIPWIKQKNGRRIVTQSALIIITIILLRNL